MCIGVVQVGRRWCDTDDMTLRGTQLTSKQKEMCSVCICEVIVAIALVQHDHMHDGDRSSNYFCFLCDGFMISSEFTHAQILHKWNKWKVMQIAFLFFFSFLFLFQYLFIWRSYMNFHCSGRRASVIKHKWFWNIWKLFVCRKQNQRSPEHYQTRVDIGFLCSTLQIYSLPSTSPHLHNSAPFFGGSFLCPFLFFKCFSLFGLFGSISSVVHVPRADRAASLWSSLSWLNNNNRYQNKYFLFRCMRDTQSHLTLNLTTKYRSKLLLRLFIFAVSVNYTIILDKTHEKQRKTCGRSSGKYF